MRLLVLAGVLWISVAACAAQAVVIEPLPDSDRDGLPDVQEDSLLLQFAPRFMISREDCSTEPAQFIPLLLKPVVLADNGTIYGQAFPRPGHAGQVELHYYDLWRRDCGQRGHTLDAEHVSALVSRDSAGQWKAVYWYAAAHEDTLCDASQIARATALDAETRGPKVWISNGKHAAFLEEGICARSCGADRCTQVQELTTNQIVNLGEPSAPMNGASWAASAEWPLGKKLGRSDFVEARMEKLDRLPSNQIAWANPGKRPAQAAILGGDDAIAGAGTGLRATNSALTAADLNTGDALNSASGKTGNALSRSYRGVKKALQAATRGTEHALGGK